MPSSRKNFISYSIKKIERRKQRFCLPPLSTDYPTCRCLQQGFHMSLLEPRLIKRPSKTDVSRTPRRPPARPAGQPPPFNPEPETERDREQVATQGEAAALIKRKVKGQRSEVTGLNLLPKWGRGTLLNITTKLLPAIYIAAQEYK